MVKCGFATTRTALGTWNCAYVIIAIILIWVGAYVKGASIVTSPSIIGGIIAAGVFLLLVSLLGLYGTKTHNQVALFFYMVIIVLVAIVQFSVSVACLGQISEQNLSDWVSTGWKKSSNATIFDAEKNFHCCALEKEQQDPKHCSRICEDFPQEPQKCPPCLPIIVEKTAANLKMIGLVALFFAFTEFLGVWLTYRFRNLRDPSINPNLLFT
ncbi:hypothetical protein L596_023646 [Steinernema carpocapsae]|uniref:Tetraspanin n=1 Tax=Steinernema carpocapsae TaxID=34508 RepID=A0A4U5MEB5_STECR|nr:hypothetical protein L596_023646 [Steinernema carpocapsae]